MLSTAATTNGGPSPFGSFALLARLARGDLADLFLARRRAAGGFEKLVVIKRIHSQLTSDPELVELFLGEARVAARFDHPNVRRVYELGRVDPHFYIAVEYLEGVPLVELLLARRRDPRLTDARLMAALISQACEGLHAAHAHPGADGRIIVHGDLNPRSLFVTSQGYTKVLDFEIVEMRGALAKRHGFVRRTCAYMSPEQVRGDEVGPASDIFSLGVVAWEAVTGRRLFKQKSKELTLQAIEQGEIPRPRAFKPDLSRPLDDAITRALARDPAERFATAREFGLALEKAALTEGPPLTPLGVSATLQEVFADELSVQRNFVRRARTEPSDAPEPDPLEEAETVVNEKPIRDVDDWDSDTGASTRVSGRLFPRSLLPLKGEPTVPESLGASVDDPFSGVDTGLGVATSRPEPPVWQESSSLVRPVPGVDAPGEIDPDEDDDDDLGVVEAPTTIDAEPLARYADRTPIPVAEPPSLRPRSGLWIPAIGAAAIAAVVTYLALRPTAEPTSVAADEVDEAAPAAAPAEAAAVATPEPVDAPEVEREAAERQAAEKQAAQREAAQRQAAQRQAAQRQAAQRQAAQKQAAQKQAAQRQAAQRQAAQRQAAQRQAARKNAAAETSPQKAGRQRGPSAPGPQATQPGYLTIDSQPYATVYIDGDEKGYTPLVKVALSPGVHRIKLVSSEDGATKTLRVRIGADETTRQKVTW